MNPLCKCGHRKQSHEKTRGYCYHCPAGPNQCDAYEAGAGEAPQSEGA